MSEHCGYVVRVEQLRPHSNADRLQIATFFGNDTIVGMDVVEGEMGVYFPSDLQLSQKFCEANDLVRRKDENGNPAGGYLDPEKRNIRPIRLRGEKSDGLYLPIFCLCAFCNISELKVGDKIDTLEGTEICRKYIPRSSGQRQYHGSRAAAPKQKYAPTFYEHVETEQLAYHLNDIKLNDEIEISLKMHGTSQRTGYLPIIREKKRTLIDKLLRRPAKTYTEYGYVSGTRRVVMGDEYHGYYGNETFRKEIAKKFEGKLRKGETVYYEIVGFQGTDGLPIMASCDNRKLKDPAFVKRYGDVTIFSYGCDSSGGYEWKTKEDLAAGGTIAEPPCCEAYVYRMTMVNEDGDAVEYTPDFMRYRCAQMDVKCVPVFERFRVVDCYDPTNGMTAGDIVQAHCERYYDGPDPVGGSHVREGVVARIVNAPTFTAYKHKNYSFKVLEGIVKDVAAVPDMEEAQELQDDEAS